MHKLNYILFIIILALMDINVINAQWFSSTGNFGWSIQCLAISGNNVLAGSDNGLFLSGDDGKSWNRITSGLPSGYYPITIGVNGDNILLNTGEASSAAGSIYRSTDRGLNWTKLNIYVVNGISAFAFIDTNIFAGSFNGGIFRSTDNGKSWASYNAGFPEDSSGHLMVPNALASAGGNLYAGIGEEYQNCGLYISTDYGTSWINSGLMNVYVNNIAVCTDAAGDTNIYATTKRTLLPGDTGYPGSAGDVFLSTDKGTTWMKIDWGMTDTWAMSMAAVSNDSGGTNLFVGTGGDGVYLTSDNGKNWNAIGLPYNYVISLAAGKDDTGNSMLFAGNLGGWSTHGTGCSVFFSGDNGANWTGSIVNTYINTLALSPDGKGGADLFAVASNVLMSSTDNGDTWSVEGLPKEHFSALALSPISGGLNGTNIFLGAGPDGVYRSTDNGASWTAAGSFGGEFSYVTSLAVTPDKENDTVLFAGTNVYGGFYSTDYGATWSQVPGLYENNITSLIIKGQNEFIGTVDSGVYISINSDSIWKPINDGLTNLKINTFGLCDTALLTGTAGGIFRLVGNDAGWIASGLAGKNVVTFAVSGTNIFAGTSNAGVFLSTDTGNTWAPVNTGLANLQINAFAINGGEILAGTGGGIWRRPISEMITNVEKRNIQIPARFELSQNYPNPFNPVTNIRYSIANVQTHGDASVRLEIYDILGRKIATLVNKKQRPGNYEVTYDCGGLTSGIYMYRLQTGNYSLTKKMVILK